MNIDERIDQLTAAQERSEAMQAKTQIMLAQIVDTVGRLERIALSHEIRIDDVEAKLAQLEGRKRRPQ